MCANELSSCVRHLQMRACGNASEATRCLMEAVRPLLLLQQPAITTAAAAAAAAATLTTEDVVADGSGGGLLGGGGLELISCC